jgi:hypothetical protein
MKSWQRSVQKLISVVTVFSMLMGMVPWGAVLPAAAAEVTPEEKTPLAAVASVARDAGASAVRQAPKATHFVFLPLVASQYTRRRPRRLIRRPAASSPRRHDADLRAGNAD